MIDLLNAGKRFAVIYILTGAAFVFLSARLFNLQIVNGQDYSKLSDSRTTTSMVEKAPRGEITDRYGEVLVTNRNAYSVSLIKTDIDNQKLNEIILEVLNILEHEGVIHSDTLQTDGIDDETYNILCIEKYQISNSYSSQDIRRIAGVRYEADKCGFSKLLPYVIAEDIPVSAVVKILEKAEKLSCIIINKSFSREYPVAGFASHILGNVGKISSEEYEKYKDSNYRYSDTIGKQGVEKIAEDYLRGTDGIKNIGNSTLLKSVPAIPGDNVVLTIDMKLQRVLEQSLAETITRISSEGNIGTGGDADSGAAVVIDVKTGDVLACASYPTFSLETYNKQYAQLSADAAKPLWNRAVSGTYTPGSTFKPLVAIAALESGKLKPAEKITDEGKYTFYNDYRPRCWIWSENQSTHGSINVSQAIEKSCNYFFYETGRRTGIDIIDEYGTKFGLGEYTGIELAEEVKGYIASPEVKKNLFKNTSEQNWYGADTLQASIGQSVHSFTPVQIANYIAAIANHGTRYKLNIIKSVRSGTDGSTVYERTPQVADVIDMSASTFDAVTVGMKNVVDEGSARAIFSDYPIQIGGKTGTAQLGSKQSNNALFAAFAPFDDPEIAICVVLEHGVRGTNAAYVAKDLFDCYFGLEEEN